MIAIKTHAMLLVLALCFFVPRQSLRAEEPKRPEQLPKPKIVTEEVIVECRELNPIYVRTSRYDVWQYYGVDRYGRFRPRVVNSPYGAYFLYDGRPYPWVTLNSLFIMPFVVN